MKNCSCTRVTCIRQIGIAALHSCWARTDMRGIPPSLLWRYAEPAPTGSSSSFNKKSQVSVAGRLFKPAELPKSRSIDHDDNDEGEQFGAIGAVACKLARPQAHTVQQL